MHFQWFPGHMTKAIRSMQEDIRLIDMIIEIADARIPLSSRNPETDKLANGKIRVLLLNKKDMADDDKTREWIDHYRSKGIHALAIDSRNKGDIKGVFDLIEKAGRKKREKDLKRGIKNRPIRAMIIGIPNVGKSTFINSFIGKASTKTGNKPGVTKGKQWIRTGKSVSGVELLDTPGILWPKFDDPMTGLHLAWIGAIRDEILPITDMALDLIEYLNSIDKAYIGQKYNISNNGDSTDTLMEIATARGCVKKGGETDYDKAAKLLIDDFRGVKLGRITIECVEEVMRNE